MHEVLILLILIIFLVSILQLFFQLLLFNINKQIGCIEEPIDLDYERKMKKRNVFIYKIC